MKRLSTDAKLKPLVAQFVPIKIDVNSDDYKIWLRKHKPEKGAIPQMYIVRADGKEMYNKVGGLPSDQLFELLTSTLQQSGVVLNDSQAAAIESALENAKKFVEQKDFAQAAQEIAEYPAVFDTSILCFAEPVVELRGIASKLTEQILSHFASASESLDQFDSLDLEQKVDFAVDLQKLIDDFRDFPPTKKNAKDLRREIEKMDALKTIVKDIQTLEKLESSRSPTRLEKLQAMLAQYKGTSITRRLDLAIAAASDEVNSAKSSEESSNEKMKVVDHQTKRLWTSSNGQYTVNAVLISVSKSTVELRDSDGKTVTVQREQLSKADNEWLAKFDK